MHEAVAREVRDRVECELAKNEKPRPPRFDEVDEASDESFAASDPLWMDLATAGRLAGQGAGLPKQRGDA